MNLRVENGRNITIKFSLWTDLSEDEPIVNGETFSYMHGLQQILPGLEQQLEGRISGDNFKFALSPEEAYGISKPDNRTEMKWPIEMGEVSIGDVVGVVDGEEEYHGWVEDILEDNKVLINFNAPLADRTLTYEVDVIEVN